MGKKEEKPQASLKKLKKQGFVEYLHIVSS
jgi:hypothetical protein